MTGGIEAAGDAITGGLIARAVEPGAGEHHNGAGHGLCLNCGTALAGAYCHACGQPEHIHRSLGAIWHDLAHGVLHFEGKIWRTLPLLALRPGELTRRYIHGERARFVSPLALFLFSIFITFAAISILGGSVEVPQLEPEGRREISTQLSQQLDTQRKDLAAAERKRAELLATGADTKAIDADIAERRMVVEPLEKSVKELAEGKTPIFSDLKTGWSKLDKGIAKANANPNLVLYKIQTNAYKFSWALIPISVPFVWLMFAWHRKRRVYDHAIFVTYSLSFMSLLALLLTLLGVAGLSSKWIAIAAVFMPPLHVYKQLKGAYELGRFSALVRTFVLLVFAAVALLLFLFLLLGLGLLG